jgi:hypothetical protein
MQVSGQLHAPAALPPRGKPVTLCIIRQMGPRAGLDIPENRKISLNVSEIEHRVYDGPSRSLVAIPTEPSVLSKWTALLTAAVQNNLHECQLGLYSLTAKQTDLSLNLIPCVALSKIVPNW